MNEWQITNKGDLYTLKITDDEGTESCMLTTEQLIKLRDKLNTIPLPVNENDLPL